MVRTVLIAEDAPDVADIISFSVRMTWPGCEVVIAESGTEAIERFHDQTPDLVILDVAMPPPNGFDVCRHIRERSNVPIMMLTVQDATVDKVRAFDLGADDYLTKPFDAVELLARLRSLVRRSTGSTQSQPGYVHKDLSINFATRQVLLKKGRLFGSPQRSTGSWRNWPGTLAGLFHISSCWTRSGVLTG